jgi:hypothetical protein
MPGAGGWVAEGAAMQDWQSAVPTFGHQQDPMPMLQASWLAEVRTIGPIRSYAGVVQYQAKKKLRRNSSIPRCNSILRLCLGSSTY